MGYKRYKGSAQKWKRHNGEGKVRICTHYVTDSEKRGKVRSKGTRSIKEYIQRHPDRAGGNLARQDGGADISSRLVNGA